MLRSITDTERPLCSRLAISLAVLNISFSSRLGDDEGSMLLSWTTLNPMQLVKAMNAFSKYFDFQSFEQYMKEVSTTIMSSFRPCRITKITSDERARTHGHIFHNATK